MYSDLRTPFDSDRPEGDPSGPDRNELLAFLDFWRELPAGDRAIFARSVTGGDPTLFLLLSILLGLSGPDRNELLAFLDFWRELPGEDRAVFARGVKPDLTDEAVARLAGVSRRQLYRWPRYMAFKPRLEDYKATKRKWSSPDDDAA
jgi:hypothetical protein